MQIRLDELRLLVKQIINENTNDGENIFRTRRTPEERKRNHKIVIYHQIKSYIKGGCQGDLDLSKSPIEMLPNELKRVGGNLYLFHCSSLNSLPDGLSVGSSLGLNYCTSLVSLPNNLSIGGNLFLRYCTSLVSLPDNLSVGGTLILNSCKSLVSLPNGLSVSGGLYLYGTPLSKRYSEEEIRKIIEDKGGNVKGNIYI
jgi:hypothetical protein